jgi:CheY-like chemotaxis protein
MLRILVVDDEKPIRQLLSRWLAAWGYEVREAGNATDALALLTESPVSIVLCDVSMPDHDGLWLTDRIREQWPETAVIMASGAQDIEVIRSTRRKGAVDFVPKPFGREVLRQALLRAQPAA